MKNIYIRCISQIIILFSGYFLNAQVIQINQTFSGDTVFAPFSGTTPVYSLSMSGSVNLYSDSSLIRVVLIDIYGNHHLLFESYPLIAYENAFDTLNACDETKYLNGVLCDSLRIDIISAFLDLDSLNIDTNFIPDVKQLQAQEKWISDSIKIDIMNQRIAEEHMYWRAGRTSIVEMTFPEKERYLGSNKFYWQGFEYYKGGIFEFLSDRDSSKSSSDYVNRFDWRDRHGANNDSSPYFNGSPSPYYDGDTLGTGWLTDVKNQPCGVCWAYAAVGVVEALVNLFFNEHKSESQPTYHHIDLDLCEWQVVVCNGRDCDPLNPYISLGDPRMALNYIRDSSVVNDNCLEQPKTCGEECNSPDEIVSITRNDSIKIMYDSATTNEDWLKRCLITYGPLACSIKDFPLPNENHSMTLVGYRPLSESDLVYSDSENPANNIVIEKGSPLIGTSAWIFKNSQGLEVGNHGFLEAGFPYSRFLNESHMNQKVFGDIIRNGHTNAEIRCVDEDGDGYFWWGIHIDSAGNSVSPQQCNCPDSITNPDLEDCDDSDPDVGPYNLEPGNGPLYECLPDCDNFSYDPYIINHDEIIKRNRHFNRNVIVNAGYTLTIRNCTVSFSGQAKLVVKQGGKLVIEHATLTTKCPGVMWQGVEVWGYSGYTQNDPEHPQGEVEMLAGTIEKANIGITTVNYEYIPDGDSISPIPTFAGGIIQAENSNFINNIVAIEFYPYRFPSISYLKNCSFESTSEFQEHKLPDYFVKMLGVDSVGIYSCSFINTRNTNIDSCFKWGGGIFSYNSSVIVKKIDSQADSCKFQKLTRGIYALNSGDTKTVTVEKGIFNENYRAIYLSGMGSINATRVVSNNIKVVAPSAYIEQYPYGLYLDYCTGYKVEANTFRSTTIDDPTIGLIVNNSGSQDNMIYRNNFKTLYSGIIAQNRNRNSNGTEGLELKCNVFSGLLPNSSNQCLYDIVVTVSDGTGSEYGIKLNQGKLNPFYSSDCAGNVFSNDSIAGDQWQFINYGNDLNYNHHLYGLQGELVEPDSNRISGGITRYPKTPYVFIYDDCCEDILDDLIEDIDSVREIIYESESSVDSLETLLATVIDGGDTDELTYDVQTSFPGDSVFLRNELLLESPYLSDTVLISAIEKESVLSSGMITDILSANPHVPKIHKIMEAVSNRYETLNDEQMASIFQGLSYFGPKEQIEGEISNQKTIHSENLNKLIRYYKNNLPDNIASDSIYNLITNHGSIQKHYELICYYISLKDTIKALDIFSAIPITFTLDSKELDEYESFEDYLDIRIDMINRDYSILFPDSLMNVILYNILESNHVPSSTYARNMLLASDTLVYSEPVILPIPGLKSTTQFNMGNGIINKANNFSLYPNPASYYLIAKFDHIQSGVEGHLDFIDSNGHICKKVPLRTGSNYEVINISDLPSGLYLCNCYIGNNSLSTIKICIAR